jgi:hypothetical protein
LKNLFGENEGLIMMDKYKEEYKKKKNEIKNVINIIKNILRKETEKIKSFSEI